jgi:tetratricopeptide (TPR) repeat protein
MNEETLFQEALSRTPEERSAFLEQACTGRPELLAAVKELLAAHDKSSNILDRPSTAESQPEDAIPGEANDPATGEFVHEPGAPLVHEATSDFQPPIGPGFVIAGRYTLLEKIGEGGMGEVWVAKQTEPVKRKVAVKLIKAGMDSRAVLQRFEQERQALALMDHPHIAKVLDGGLTLDRRPFFVMELVSGLPLTRFCDEAKLGVRERLDLFVPICHAVQHAHQKGIIHRDLKPTNILVTIIDGRGVPKIIDFGVAKATSGRLTEETLSTQFGAVVGTFEYMSPEQAGFAGDDIDTRADIYSLGVILYELLTGLRPLDAIRLRKAALTEMVRIIKEEEPSKPSTRVSSDESAPSVAALRHTEPKKLAALLRGELDWVVMKCLEKQRDRRYETASGLARDLQRYLANEVVEARPPTAAYRVRKFVTRHRGQVAAVGLVLLALLAGIAGTTFGLIRAGQANSALATANADLTRSRAAVQERYDLAVDAIKTFHTGVSEDVLLKQKEFGSLRAKLLRGARGFYQKLQKVLEGQTDPRSQQALANAYYEVGTLAIEIDSLQEAFEAQRRALKLFEDLVQKDPDNLDLRHQLGRCWLAMSTLQVRTEGQYSEAQTSLKNSRAALEVVVAARPNDFEAHADLAQVLSYIGERLNRERKEALDGYFQAKDAWEALVRASPESSRARVGFAAALDNYAMALRGVRRWDQALPLFSQARELAEALVREEPGNPVYGHELIRTLGNLAGCQIDTGRLDEAMATTDRARAIIAVMSQANPTLHDFPRDLAWIEGVTSEILIRTGKDDEALSALDRAKAAREALLKVNPNEVRHQQQLALILRTQARLHRKASQFDRAKLILERAVEILEQIAKNNPDRHDMLDDLVASYCDFGDLELAAGRPAQASSWYEKASAHQRKRTLADPSNAAAQSRYADAIRRIGTAIQASGHPADAINHYRRSLAQLETVKHPTPIDVYDMACCRSLIAGAAAEGGSGLSPTEAEVEAVQAVALVRRAFAAGYSNLIWVRADDPDLKPIRIRPDFQQLMKELAAPAKPSPGH